MPVNYWESKRTFYYNGNLIISTRVGRHKPFSAPVPCKTEKSCTDDQHLLGFLWLFVRKTPSNQNSITPPPQKIPSALPLVRLGYNENRFPTYPNVAQHAERGRIQTAASSNDVSVRKPSLLTHWDWHNHLLTLLPWKRHTSTKVVVTLPNDNVVQGWAYLKCSAPTPL